MQLEDVKAGDVFETEKFRVLVTDFPTPSYQEVGGGLTEAVRVMNGREVEGVPKIPEGRLCYFQETRKGEGVVHYTNSQGFFPLVEETLLRIAQGRYIPKDEATGIATEMVDRAVSHLRSGNGPTQTGTLAWVMDWGEVVRHLDDLR